MDGIKQLSKQLKNLETAEEKLRLSPIKSDHLSIFAESFLDFVRLHDKLPNLPESYELRALRRSDNYRGYLELLSQLGEEVNVTSEMFSRRFNAMRNTSPPSYYIIVIEQIDIKRIVASATLFLEFKFTHQAGCLGRIEDIVVDKTVPYLFFPKILCQYLVSLARHVGAFRLLLECKTEIPSYSELGFEKDMNISFIQNFKDTSNEEEL